MEKTIKQMADELEVDKQKIYRFIKKHHINEVHQKNGIFYYDKVAQSLIYQAFAKNTISNETHQNDTINNLLVLMLQKELEQKNKQIEELTAIVKQQAESINASEHNSLAKTLIDEQKQLITSNADEEPQKKQSILSKIFKK